MNPIQALILEDVATGKTRPIPVGAGVALASVGKKPTVRAKVDDTVQCVRWELTRGGKPVAGFDAWYDVNAPFRLVPGDGTVLTLSPATYVVSATPCDGDRRKIGPAVTTTLIVVAAATDGQPTPPPAKDSDGDHSGAPPHPATLPSHLVKGLVDGNLVDVGATIARLDGTRTNIVELCRLWDVQVNRPWFDMVVGQLPSAKTFDKMVAWHHAAGVPTMLLCCPLDGGGAVIPSVKQTAAWFTELARMIKSCGLDTEVEAYNEPNLEQYWKARSIPLLMRTFVTPALDVLRSNGIRTVGPSPTGSVACLKELRANGLVADAMGFHTYRTAAALLRPLLSDLTAVTGDDPIDITEFNRMIGRKIRAWDVIQKNPAPKGGWTQTAIAAIDPKAELPAVSPSDTVADLLDQWAVLQGFRQVRRVLYYTSLFDPKTTNGRQALIARDGDGTLRESVFSRDFWAVAA